MAVITVDSKGTACPGPITDLVKAYRKASNGDVIELLATDPGVRPDTEAWCARTGNKLLGIVENQGVFTVRIEVSAKK